MDRWIEKKIGEEKFLLWEEGNVSFLCSVGNKDYRDLEDVKGLARPLGLSSIIGIKQVHSASIADADKTNSPLEGDGLMVSMAGVGIYVLTADCLPVLIISHGRMILLHVGWRGLAKGIIQNALYSIKQFVNDMDNIKIIFGPCIGPCCYEVGEDLLRDISESLAEGIVRISVLEKEGKWFFDLPKAAESLFLREGISPKNIKHIGLCTCCSGLFPSYRRDGDRASRLINICWKKDG